MSGTFKIKRFGRYLLLDHLVDGGMAKICRARFLGEQANKIVAIKMIQEQYSKDGAFVQMFKDELKVTFGLNHPNIAQTYDYGDVEGILYTAMEYVDGANLKQFLDRLKKRKYVFPVEISTFIISQVCQALFYAHTFTDKLTGKSYNIIHRDISPHNIMITYDGAVKVIDFGIAKAETNSESTQAGTIKGKLSYLAPEYLEGHELDHRYDMFAVGITLWEMLCSRKLFTAVNDLAVLKEIQACKIPAPSSVNPNVPQELDEIVLKALQKDRELRFTDMDAFNRALVRFLYSKYPDFNATDLAFFAKELFKEDIKKDREKLKEYGKMDISQYIKDFERSQRRPETKIQTVDSSTVEALIVKKKQGTEFEYDPEQEVDLEFTRTTNSSRLMSKIQNADKRARGSTYLKNNRKGGGRSGNRNGRSRIHNNTPVPKQSSQKTPALVLVALGVLGFLFKDQILNYVDGLKGRKTASYTKKSYDKNLQGKIFLENYDPFMEVSINGKPVKFSPLGIKVPTEVDFILKVSKKNFSSFTKKLRVNKNKKVLQVYIPDLTVKREGLLTTSLNYPKGSKIIYFFDGKRFEKNLPLKNHRMPAGIYEAIIDNPASGTKRKLRLRIEENKKHFLE
jgi:serine/threonine-protein kinase